MQHFIGLMSGTSIDGVDGVLLTLHQGQPVVQGSCHRDMPQALRQALLTLNTPGPNELHSAALAANDLMRLYAQVVHSLLADARLSPTDIVAIGAHGQTVRHQPPSPGQRPDPNHPWPAYTCQLHNAALLAELTGISVVADFRSRDIAAGGQGAPLVPAFHQTLFARHGETVAVVNVGGMANVTLLSADGSVSGCDTGPGNVLMDIWCERHTGQRLDGGGIWAAQGQVHAALLSHLQQDGYFSTHGPRSTGRDHFNPRWLDAQLAAWPAVPPADVQATLCELTAWSVAESLPEGTAEVVVCGGGVFNATLMDRLAALARPAQLVRSDERGLPAMDVEAAAFAWLASRTLANLPGNVVDVTGASGPRVLGAVYSA